MSLRKVAQEDIQTEIFQLQEIAVELKKCLNRLKKQSLDTQAVESKLIDIEKKLKSYGAK